jgi:large subunit ribosomal protein L17
MRHRSKAHSFGRRHGPRHALIRGLVVNLVEVGRIKTTLARCKEVRRHAERAVTMAKKDSLHARRILLSRYANENAVGILCGDLSKRFAKREGGYTRIIKIGPRPGDQADVAYLEFVDFTPAKANADEVKGDKGAAKRGKAKSILTAKLRKNRRVIQSASRQEAAILRK